MQKDNGNLCLNIDLFIIVPTELTKLTETDMRNLPLIWTPTYKMSVEIRTNLNDLQVFIAISPSY